MKKKKLKKRLEKLEQLVADNINSQNTISRSLRDRISSLDTSIDNNHQSCKSEFGTIKASIRELKNRVDVLDKRTKVDYTQFSSKTCGTCKWEPLMKHGGQDIPCMGCTDKKMFEPKGENNGN